MTGNILAIDQGTTSSRAIVFDDSFAIRAVAQEEFPQHFPASGWVEHDADDLWQTTLRTAREALAKAGLEASDIAAIGITNQRETVVVWDRHTGKAIHRAIVWQDRRTADFCAELKAAGHEAMVSEKTGLLLDPYFSGTKLAWILDNVDGARAAAEAGDLAFGTVDSFLLWQLTGGTVHATDATNASRTLLYNIHDNDWDDTLLDLLRIPRAMLPEVRDCASDFGTTEPGLFDGAIAVLGIAGDQQAATLGNACFSPGMVKSTYGTGCFALINTGADAIASKNRLLTTIAYRFDGETTYALEGSIFIAGAAVQWLRDGLGIIGDAAQSGDMAQAADPGQAVVLVPAFTGLGAPYWDGGDTVLRVDAGMVASDWTMQRLADILNAPVDRPEILETTALGAAWLAGHKAGVWPGQSGFLSAWRLDRRFEPVMEDAVRSEKLAAWKDAVSRTLSR
jgi:glycerol kinase